MSDKLLRMEYLIKQEGITKLKNAKVLVAGVGGVGSFCAEALARSGVGTIILVDFDTIDISNMNRQLEVTKENIGASKVHEMAQRLRLVSDCQVIVKETFIDEQFELDHDLDYVIDCVDTLSAKFILAKKAKALNIKHLASMGAARRLDPSKIVYTKLSKTYNDPLAKNFRALCRKEKFKHDIRVVCSLELPNKQEICIENALTRKKKYPLGSSIMVVGSVGLMLSSIVIKDILEVK